MPDWTVTLSNNAMSGALAAPMAYLIIDFGSALVIGIIVLFWADIQRWQHARGMLP